MVLDRMRGLGVSERTVRLERDARILMQILDPSTARQWIRDKNARFDDPDKTRLYLACDQAIDCDPRDPSVDRLIEELDAWQIDHEGDISQPELKLLDSLIAEASPAWQRIVDVLAHRARQRRTAVSSK